MAEKGWRFLRKQRRSVALTAVAVVTTLVLGSIGLGVWFTYRQWMLGHVQFSTDHPYITVELTSESDKLAVPTFVAPTGESVAIPAGDYQLRVSSDGRLSQNYRINILRGIETEEYRFNLEDQLLWPTINVSRAFDLVDLQGNADVIVLDDNGIKRIRGLDGSTVVWELNLDDTRTNPSDTAGIRWPWDVSYTEGERSSRPPQIVKPSLDLDRDGVRDLVFAANHQAWLLSVSGKTGKVLWFARRGSDLKELDTSERLSTTVGVPQPIDDQNDDGVPDLVVTFAEFAKDMESDDFPRRWVETISGSTGITLWTYDLNNDWFDLPSGQNVPEHSRWFWKVTEVKDEGATASTYRGDVARFDLGFTLKGEWRYVPEPARTAEIGQQPVIVEIAGTMLLSLDPTTGKQRHPPIDLGFAPIQTPIVTDVDADGS